MKDEYHSARQALQRAKTFRDPDKRAIALALALKHCAKARAHSWSRQKLVRAGLDSWGGANTAARRLAKHLEQLDRMTATMRIVAASNKSGVPVRGNVPAWLRALANQVSRTGRGGFAIGPLVVGKPSRKQDLALTALTIVLAHMFNRALKHDGDGPITIYNGESISKGAAWNAAAEFAIAALKDDATASNVASAAKKFLSDHRRHVTLRTWPQSRRSSKSLNPADIVEVVDYEATAVSCPAQNCQT